MPRDAESPRIRGRRPTPPRGGGGSCSWTPCTNRMPPSPGPPAGRPASSSGSRASEREESRRSRRPARPRRTAAPRSSRPRATGATGCSAWYSEGRRRSFIAPSTSRNSALTRHRFRPSTRVDEHARHPRPGYRPGSSTGVETRRRGCLGAQRLRPSEVDVERLAAIAVGDPEAAARVVAGHPISVSRGSPAMNAAHAIKRLEIGGHGDRIWLPR